MKTDPLPQVLREAVARGEMVDSNGKVHSMNTNITLAEAHRLYEQVIATKPRLSVEVGLAGGISSVAILQGLSDLGIGKHHIIDPFQHHFHDCGLELINRCGLQSSMIFHRRFPDEVIPQLDPIEFAFVDGSHLFDITLSEFVMIDRKLMCGGQIGFHDAWMPSIRRLLSFILANRDYRLSHDTKSPNRAHQMLSFFIRRIPRHEDIFQTKLFRPEIYPRIPNLFFLEKLDHDQRDWRHYVKF